MNDILPKAPDLERWKGLSFIEQMANISSEVGRCAKWKRKGNEALAKGAFIRALDLIDATIAVGRIKEPQHRDAMLKELCRARALFCEEYLEIEPSEGLAATERYFNDFAMAYALM